MRAKEEAEGSAVPAGGLYYDKDRSSERRFMWAHTILLAACGRQLWSRSGARDKNFDKNGLASAMGGVGAKMSPSAILVVQNGQIRMVSVKNQDTVTKIIDMVPDVLERVKNGFEKEKANKEARKAVDEAMEKAADEAE